MHVLMEFFSNNKFHKNTKYGRAAFTLRDWRVVGLAFVLCFMLMPFSVYAATTGSEHHKDTRDYCMTVHDVSVGLQELEGRSESQKEDRVESASKYRFYLWNQYPYRTGARVHNQVSDFSNVNWTKEGTYTINVSLPQLTQGVSSSISYKLKIIDDLEHEDPVDPGGTEDPVNPDNPGGTEDPDNPDNPGGQVDPVNPDNPDEQVDPVNPSEDVDPVRPVNPSDTVNPIGSIDPADSMDNGGSADSDKSGSSGGAKYSGSSSNSRSSGNSGSSGNAGNSRNSGNSGNAGNSAYSANSGNSGNSSYSADSGESTYSAYLGNSDGPLDTESSDVKTSSLDNPATKSGSSGSLDANTIITTDRSGSSGINTPIWKLGIGLTELIILGFLSALIVSDLKVIIWYNKKKKS